MTRSEVCVCDAKARLSELVRDVLSGKVVIITRRQKPVIQLIPIKEGEAWCRLEQKDGFCISRAAQIAIDFGQYDLAKQILQLQGA